MQRSWFLLLNFYSTIASLINKRNDNVLSESDGFHAHESREGSADSAVTSPASHEADVRHASAPEPHSPSLTLCAKPRPADMSSTGMTVDLDDKSTSKRDHYVDAYSADDCPLLSPHCDEASTQFPTSCVETFAEICQRNMARLTRNFSDLLVSEFSNVNTNVKDLSDNVDNLNDTFNSLHTAVNNLDVKFNSLDTTFNNLDVKFNSLDSKVDNMDEKISSLDTTVK